MADLPARRWNWLAFIALGIGALGLWIWVLAPLALALGFLALVRINESDGQQRGGRLAIAAMIAGGLGSVLLALGLLSMIFVGVAPYQARTADANQLRQIGLAIHGYRKRSGNLFPPAVSLDCPLPADQRLSWQVLILPDLEQRQGGSASFVDLAKKLDPKKGFEDPTNAACRIALRPFRSPSALPGQAEDATNYVGITGVGADAASLPLTDPRVGFFGNSRVVGPEEILAGMAYTFAVTETTRGGPWAGGGSGTAVGVPAEGDAFVVGPGRTFGGLHPGGFHLLFIDGHVDFRRDSFPPALLREQARILRRD